VHSNKQQVSSPTAGGALLGCAGRHEARQGGAPRAASHGSVVDRTQAMFAPSVSPAPDHRDDTSARKRKRPQSPQAAAPISRRRNHVTFNSGVVTYHVAEVHGKDSGYAETVLAADNSASVKIADGPRPESILLNDLIVTHFESWTLCDARAVALFVGEPRFRAIGGDRQPLLPVPPTRTSSLCPSTWSSPACLSACLPASLPAYLPAWALHPLYQKLTWATLSRRGGGAADRDRGAAGERGGDPRGDAAVVRTHRAGTPLAPGHPPAQRAGSPGQSGAKRGRRGRGRAPDARAAGDVISSRVSGRPPPPTLTLTLTTMATRG
jgi:hypothetical protein